MNKISSEEESKLKALFLENPEAMNAYNILKYTKHSVFLTGKAGTGKSTFLKLVKSIYPFPTPIIAPTAISARNVDGETIHSYFRLPPEFLLPRDERIQNYYPSNYERQWFSYIDLIILEEISMVSAVTLDCIDCRLKQICNNKLPFGGIQMLFVGDPFQLPPIVKEANKRIFYANYANEHFFESRAFKELNPINIELQIPYRQNDKMFLTCLDSIRCNSKVEESIKLINDCCFYNKNTARWSSCKNIVTICYRNEFAHLINMRALSLIPEEELVYRAIVEGEFNWAGVVAEAQLYLRKGAFVMLTKNHPDKLYVNGTLGYIEDLHMDKIIVRGEDGKQFEVVPEKWCQSKWIKTQYGLLWKREEIILGTMHQFPIKLAYAITINKSQGLTFENVSFNNNVKPFSAGQIYVALSRSRTFEGLKLTHKLNKNDIKVDKNVLRFYKTIQKEKRLPVILDEVNKEINDEIMATDSSE